LKFSKTPFEGVYIILPQLIKDQRGGFGRIFCENEFKRIDYLNNIVQINYSHTKEIGTVRGMHYQKPPMMEIKMVKCLSGSIYDVIIDLREGSRTFLKWHSEILSKENGYMIYIPKGFAHGFQTLEPNCELMYFHTEFYSPDLESAVRFDDPRIRIKWPLDVNGVSYRDRSHALLPEEFKGVLV